MLKLVRCKACNTIQFLIFRKCSVCGATDNDATFEKVDRTDTPSQLKTPERKEK